MSKRPNKILDALEKIFSVIGRGFYLFFYYWNFIGIRIALAIAFVFYFIPVWIFVQVYTVITGGDDE